MDLKAVGQRIKATREAKNLTQEELAALVNLSPTHVSVIERTESNKTWYLYCDCKCIRCFSRYTIDWCCDTFGYWCYEWIIWNDRETTERKATENYQCSESIGGINTWIRRWKGLLLFFFIWFNVKIWYSSSKDLYIILRNLIKWRKKI